MRAIVLLGLASCAAPPDAPTPTPLDAYATAMLALQPVGYWRLDERDTSVMLDATAAANHGAYHSAPRLGDPGFDGTAAHFSGAAQYGEIPNRAEYSLTRAWDDFDRSTSFAWGAAWTGRGEAYFTIGGIAWIDPLGDAGTFEQGLPVRLARGDLQVLAAWSDHGAGLQPVALIAERVDDHNFVRAELRETADALELHLVATMAGQDMELASTELGPATGTWFLRFEFDGTALQARAWPAEGEQPATWLTASSAAAAEGTIAIRSANSESTVRPRIALQHFRAQTLGLTVHAAVRLDPNPPVLEQILGKGDHSGFTSGTDQEFHLRYDHQRLKGYAFNRDGGFGAGEAFDAVAERWYDVVLEFDPGDYRDPNAGVHMIVDGIELPTGPGSHYRSNPCTADDPTCWTIDPRNGNAPLRIGTSDGESFFAGDVDEVAIFDRLLTADELTSLRR
ncbi:MAG TPA: LamG-like jellyroll fold domain-containing protein [Kofleriaceae bacterium]